MILQKWNEKKRVYLPYEVPDNWNVKFNSDDMDEIVNCAHCGQKIKFGECFTSRQIHTDIGFGYGVCGKCYEIEIAVYQNANNRIIAPI